jgi:hypothetical protein
LYTSTSSRLGGGPRVFYFSTTPSPLSGEKAEDRPKSTKGLKPKILDEKLPVETEDVRKHNEELSHRADGPLEHVDIKPENQPPRKKEK